MMISNKLFPLQAFYAKRRTLYSLNPEQSNETLTTNTTVSPLTNMRLEAYRSEDSY